MQCPTCRQPPGTFLSAAGFAFFVLWLLAFPMEGPLLVHTEGDHHLFLFLGPQIIALTLLARRSAFPFFPRLTQIAVPATAALTILAAANLVEMDLLLPIIGLISAPVCIRAGAGLKMADNPVHAGALGLVGGNLLFLLFLRISLPTTLKFIFIAGGLLIVSFSALPRVKGRIEAENLPFLPFLLAFNLVSGIMYRGIALHYADLAFWPGAELLFYIGAIVGGIFLLRLSREAILICGIVTGMAAILCLQPMTAPTVNLSMFAMQAAAGFVDLFVMAFFLSCRNPVKAFGYGSAMICSGIFLGGLITASFRQVPDFLVLTGQVSLNAAAVILFLRRSRQHPATADVSPSSAGLSSDPCKEELKNGSLPIPSEVRAVLSSQELRVLELVLAGRIYRDIAFELAISESTVKTYMSRIYEKMGVFGKGALKKVLASGAFPAL